MHFRKTANPKNEFCQMYFSKILGIHLTIEREGGVDLRGRLERGDSSL